MADDELDALEAHYLDWDFGVVWTSRTSGPDVRQVYAKQGRVKLVAFDVGGLRRMLEEHTFD